MNIGLFATHPVQYYTPWFQALAKAPGVDMEVFYGFIPDVKQQGDGFGVQFKWDLPLLEGYNYRILKNRCTSPSVNGFFQCDTPSIYEEIASGRFDVFIINGWLVKSCLQAIRACRKARVPVICRGESNAMRPRGWKQRLFHRLLLSRYQAFLSIGTSNQEFYLSNGVPPERIFSAPYCVDNARFARTAAEWQPRRAELRQRWGIPADAVVFLFCAKFIPKKRPLDLLTALSLVQRSKSMELVAGSGEPKAWSTANGEPRTANLERPPLNLEPSTLNFQRSPFSFQPFLLMVGDGELRGECEAFARQHNLPVAFAGFLNQTEMPQTYAAADCLVLPSDHGETWGLVTNEAMACGLPAIVSGQVGCGPDLIIPGDTGWIYPCGDTVALAARMQTLMSDPALLSRMKIRAAEHIQSFTIEKAVQGTLEAVNYCMGKKSTGKS